MNSKISCEITVIGQDDSVIGVLSCLCGGVVCVINYPVVVIGV
ncbi:hypothetical protein V7O66_02160 [Methanolobus sp. ZRKC3]